MCIGAVLFSALILTLAAGLSKKKALDFNALSPFECGFEKSDPSLFSLRYFLVALIFLLFDLEVLLLFPSTASLNIIMGIALAVFLTLGLFWEWNQTFLSWAK